MNYDVYIVNQNPLFDIFDNKDFDTGADLVLDLSEVNPFGNP